MKTATKRKGVVLGDFSPVNVAHVHMIEFARHYVDELTIVVDEHQADSISFAKRQSWLQDLFPGVTVTRVKSRVWHKSDGADYSPSLLAGMRRLLPRQGGFIFSLDERGKRIAEELGATFMPVDATTVGVTVSEREIRENPLKFWDLLPRAVRPSFVKRVCVFGPESTGKSTLAKNLAARFNTVAVPEYAKTYIETYGREIGDEDMVAIARGQCALEDAMAREANRVIFCDSDLVTSIIWSGRLVGTIPEWLRNEADRRHYDLYLLTHYDVPWVDDVHRYIPKESSAFFDRCLLELEGRQRHFVQVKGGWDERLELAAKAVEELLSM